MQRFGEGRESSFHTESEPPDASGVHVARSPNLQALRRRAADLLPHEVDSIFAALERAQLQVQELSEANEAMAMLLNRVPWGLLVLGRSGTVLVSNHEARRLMRTSALRLEQGHLMSSNAPLQLLVRSTVDRVFMGRRARVAVEIPRPSGSIHMVVSPGGRAMDGVVVAIFDPAATRDAPAELFEDVYGLTPAQSRVAAHLAFGRTPSEIAELLGIGVETTRSHVKQVLLKLGCHRQADAVRKLVLTPLDKY